MNKHINIFKYLILVMILTIINYPITVYADDNGDWHYQTDENDAEYFDEMLELEWNSTPEKKKAEYNGFEDYKQHRLSQLKNRVVIKYTLKQPDENGQTVVYKDYGYTTTVGDKSNGTYFENFYYETDWQRNVNSVDIWLPCTVNSSSDAPQIKNPGKEYKTITDENGKEIWDDSSGYGGNFCMGWGGEFYNFLDNEIEHTVQIDGKIIKGTEKTLFSQTNKNGWYLFSCAGKWDDEWTIDDAINYDEKNDYDNMMRHRQNIKVTDFSHQNWKHYDPTVRNHFYLDFTDNNENKQKSFLYGMQGSWANNNQYRNANDSHISYCILIKVDNNPPKVGIFEDSIEKLYGAKTNVEYTKYFENATRLNSYNKTKYVSKLNLYLNVKDLESGLKNIPNNYVYYITDTDDANIFSSTKYTAIEYIPEQSNQITLDLDTGAYETNYIWVPAVKDIMGWSSDNESNYKIVDVDGISYHVFGPYVLNKTYTVTYNNGQTNCSTNIPDTFIAMDYANQSLEDGSILYGRKYNITYATGDAGVNYSSVSIPNQISPIDGYCKFNNWKIKDQYYNNKYIIPQNNHLSNIHNDIVTATAQYTDAIENLEINMKRGSYVFCGWKLSDDNNVQSSDTTSWTSTSVNGLVTIENTISNGKVTKSTLRVNGSKEGENLLNIVVIAVWKLQPDTLYFDYNGGENLTGTSKIKVSYGQSIGKLPPTKKVGNILINWLGENNETWKDNRIWDLKEKEYTIKANWKEIVYNIEYKLNGGYFEGEAQLKTEVRYSEEFTVPSPRNAGNIFTGWTITIDDSELTGKTSPYSKLVNSYKDNIIGERYTVVFTANWQSAPSILHFNYNGGTPNTPENKELYWEQKIGTLPSPGLHGYIFENWYKESDFKTIWNEEEIWRVEKPTTVEAYAKYNPIEYQIEYILNGGSLQNAPKSAKYDEVFKVSNPTKYGYTFAGWDIENTQSDAVIKENQYKNLRYETGTVIFTAKWENKQYTIHCYDENGKFIINVPVYYNEEIQGMPDLSNKKGYNSFGWHIERNNKQSEEYKNGQIYPYTKDIDVYMVYEPIEYTIRYSYPNGTMKFAPTKAIYDRTIIISNVERPGYRFNGWTITNSDNDKSGVKDTTFKNLRSSVGEVLFTGNFTVYNYNIVYDYNAPSWTVTNTDGNPTRVQYDETFTVKTPKRADGYTFAGWTIEGMDSSSHIINDNMTKTTSINGIKASSIDGNCTFKNLTGQNEATITFKAAWIANDRLVAFFTEQGEMTGGSIMDNLWTIRLLQSGDTNFKPLTKYGNTWTVDIPKVSRIGYDFKGYYFINARGQKETIYNSVYNKQVGNSIWNNSGKYIGNNALLIADWKAKKYSVIYHINGDIIGTYAGKWKDGTINNKTLEVIYDSTQNSIGYKDSDVYKPGYSLSGWYLNKYGDKKLYNADGTCLKSEYWTKDYETISLKD